MQRVADKKVKNIKLEFVKEVKYCMKKSNQIYVSKNKRSEQCFKMEKSTLSVVKTAYMRQVCPAYCIYIQYMLCTASHSRLF